VSDALDPAVIQAHAAELEPALPQFAKFFYGYLFTGWPETEAMFPLDMTDQRDRFVTELAGAVAAADQVNRLDPHLRALAVDHRKYGATPAHFAPVGESLIATFEHFSGPHWTDERNKHWRLAYDLIAGVMIEAMEEADHSGLPAWWDATVIAHEKLGVDVAVFTVATDLPYPYLPGESVPLCADTIRPRVWRHYSPANAPTPDGRLTFHVRIRQHGTLSGPLVHRLTVGDTVKLGQPTGRALTLHDYDRRRPIIMLAGGTGIAPMLALLEQLAAERNTQPDGRHPSVVVFYGARTAEDLYARPALDAMVHGDDPDRVQGRYPWLYAYNVTDWPDPSQRAITGRPVDVALNLLGDIAGDGYEIYVCGPPDMVTHSRETLRRYGVPPALIHTDEQNGTRYQPTITPSPTPKAAT
jgi:NAD(P)H-flavin reductase/hemoglobin-like flavoprotein